jgi:hypothetical protein
MFNKQGSGGMNALDRNSFREESRRILEAFDFRRTNAREKSDEFRHANLQQPIYLFWKQGGENELDLAIDPGIDYAPLLNVAGVSLNVRKLPNGIRFGSSMSDYPGTFQGLTPADPGSRVGRMICVDLKMPPAADRYLNLRAFLAEFLRVSVSGKGLKGLLSSTANKSSVGFEGSSLVGESVVEQRDGKNEEIATYLGDADKRRAVEERAVECAIHIFRDELGYQVDERGKPYDLECTKGESYIHVEVKGTTGLGKKVIVTTNEVSDARNQKWQSDLFIVSNIRLEGVGREWVGKGGNVRRIENWFPKDEDLRPLQFDYSVPKEK